LIANQEMISRWTSGYRAISDNGKKTALS